MHRYELVVIITPQIADDEVQEAVERLVRKPIESQGGVCQDVNLWGRRKLAYPVKKQMEGNYVLTQLEIDPGKARELEQSFLISEEVIRHLLVRLDE